MSIKIICDDNSYENEVQNVIVSAFNQEDEARLVQRIKNESDFYISYLAIDEENNKVVGHVMISPMLLNDKKNILCLAPVSVIKEYENRGIGASLIKKAIKDACNFEQYKLLTVLGSDHYYSRFGFRAYDANKFNLPFEIEPRYFQIIELENNYLLNASGNFSYPEYFLLDSN